MPIESITSHDRFVEVFWTDGGNDRYHYIWLRDHLPEATFFDATTGERLLDAHDYLGDNKPGALAVDSQGDLAITWSSLDRAVHYPARWLRANAYSKSHLIEREKVIPAAEAWPFEGFAAVPKYDYQSLLGDPKKEFDFLRDFRVFGFAYVTNAPPAPGVVESLAGHFGYVREGAFGRVREIRNEPGYDNVAFTTRDAKPHIDASNYVQPFDVQFLHCIVNAAEGGDSALVDGYAAARQLQQAAPQDYEILCRIKVSYFIGAGQHDVRHSAPVLELDRDGVLRTVRFSNQQRRVLSIPFDDVEAFYRAYGHLSNLINSPANQLSFRFAAGDLLMFDNHRLLHARQSFRADSGARHLQPATTDMDMVDSRLRLLVRKFGEETHLEKMLPKAPTTAPIVLA